MRQRMRRLRRSIPAATLRTRRSDGVAGSNAKTLSSGRTGYPSNMTDDFQNLVPVCQRPPKGKAPRGRRNPICKYNYIVAKRKFAGIDFIENITGILKKSSLFRVSLYWVTIRMMKKGCYLCVILTYIHEQVKLKIKKR